MTVTVTPGGAEMLLEGGGRREGRKEQEEGSWRQRKGSGKEDGVERRGDTGTEGKPAEPADRLGGRAPLFGTMKRLKPRGKT